jgi:hypothetical protein
VHILRKLNGVAIHFSQDAEPILETSDEGTHFADRERSTPRYDTSFDSIEGIPCQLASALSVDVSFGAPISVFRLRYLGKELFRAARG